MTEGEPPEQPLARLLLLATRWFDHQLLTELERQGWPRLSSAQSLVFAHIGDGGLSPAELARRLGTSRQATHELVRGLVRLGLLDVRDDPERRGGKRVQLTDTGAKLAVAGYETLRGLETELGDHQVRELRRLLAGFDDARRPMSHLPAELDRSAQEASLGHE